MPHPQRRLSAYFPSVAIEPVGGEITKCVAHAQCNVRPTLTFPAAERHRPLTGTKLQSGPKKWYPGFNFAITSVNVHRF